MEQTGGMTAKGPEVWRQTNANEVDGTPGTVGGSERSSLVCPLIPSRMKYTCSGRCRGCKSDVAGTEGAAGGSSKVPPRR